MTPDTGQHLDVRLDPLARRHRGQRPWRGYPYLLGDASAAVELALDENGLQQRRVFPLMRSGRT